MRQPRLVDLHNVYHPEEAERHGIVYAGIGRATQSLYRGFPAEGTFTPAA